MLIQNYTQRDVISINFLLEERKLDASVSGVKI